MFIMVAVFIQQQREPDQILSSSFRRFSTAAAGVDGLWLSLRYGWFSMFLIVWWRLASACHLRTNVTFDAIWSAAGVCSMV
jgi:hypothetical protein